jgi:cytochrome P450
LTDLAAANLFDPELLSHPHNFYDHLLAEAPIHCFAGTGIWQISSHALVAEACGRPEDFSNDITALIAGARSASPEVMAITDKGWPQEDVLLMSDPPAHTRYRKLVNLAFSLKRVDAIEHRIRAIVGELIEAMATRERCDFVQAFAIPLPVRMIAGELGLPPEDKEKVKYWSTAFVDRLGSMISPERELECARQVVEFQHAMKAQIDIRLAAPRDDLLSDLVNATVEGEDPLSIAEIMSIIQQILVAGNESTTNTLAEGLVILMRTPDIFERLRAEPALIPNAVEEMLRIAGPVAGSWRTVARDCELGGVQFPKGATVMLRNASANLDPARYPEPHTFRPERANARTHLAFGRGIHQCIGNLLARRELAVALEMLVARFDRFELDCGEADLTYMPNVLLRGPSAVPVRPVQRPQTE